MEEALRQARKAVAKGEVPVGAVLVVGGQALLLTVILVFMALLIRVAAVAVMLEVAMVLAVLAAVAWLLSAIPAQFNTLLAAQFFMPIIMLFINLTVLAH
jgi:hypothetical protein